MKFLFLAFRSRFRNNALNNLRKSQKIKNIIILNFSGPILIWVALFFYKLFKFPSFLFLSCDGNPLLKNSINSLNLWMGGTIYKIPEEFRNDNSYVVMESIFSVTNRKVQFYPCQIKKNLISNNFKFVYISNCVHIEEIFSLKLWNAEKKNILNNFSIIDSNNFWKPYLNKIGDSIKLQGSYKNLKNLLRQEIILEFYKNFSKKTIIVGSSWKNLISSAVNDLNKREDINNLYTGNVCIDLGSKHGHLSLYPRSIHIIESGGLLFQSIQKDSYKMFNNLINDISYNSLEEMLLKADIFLKNPQKLNYYLDNLYNKFSNQNYNYQTLNNLFKKS